MNTLWAKLTKIRFVAMAAMLADELGIKAYLVGGGLRDMLMGREIKDLDFALEGYPEKFPEEFARRIEGNFFWLNKRRLQARVLKKNVPHALTFDFAPLRGVDIIQDLSLRDFTINAFAVSLTEKKPVFIDPLNGLYDLQQALIRACSKACFAHDPLRLLRAIRIAATTGFSIVPETWWEIRVNAPLLHDVAPERIRSEFFQLLDTRDAAGALGRLYESALLPEIIPIGFKCEMNASSDIELVIDNLIEVERIIAEPVIHFPDVGEHVNAYLGREVESGVSMASLVKLAMILNATDNSSATLAFKTADRLRLGSKARWILQILCRTTGRMSPLPFNTPTERAYFRFFRDGEPAGLGELIIAYARKRLMRELCVDMAKYYFTIYPSVLDEPYLTGEEIMAILHIGPGRMVGQTMTLLKDAESAGLVNNKAEALAYLGKKLLTKDAPVR